LPEIGKKAAEDASQRAFSRAISNDFQALLGQPYHDAVAELTAVVFKLTDATRVRRRSPKQAAHSRKKST
jgi:hypothetical protein